MQELLQKRVDLLKEKEELLKERQMIANQSKQGAAPTAQRPKEPAVAPSKRAEDLMSAVNGNIFQGGDTGAKKTSNKKKEDDEKDGKNTLERWLNAKPLPDTQHLFGKAIRN